MSADIGDKWSGNGLNWFAYGGNPLTGSDPSGLSFPSADWQNFIDAGADMTAAGQGYDAASGIGKPYSVEKMPGI